MSRVRTLSRKYPSYHSKCGQPTFFVEKLLNWYWNEESNPYHNVQNMLIDLNGDKWDEHDLVKFADHQNREIKEWKLHTIRAGNHFKVGDKFSPRVWSGTPYKSKQIIIAPDIKIKKIWNFEIVDFRFKLNGSTFGSTSDEMMKIAINDGLELKDFHEWFRYPKPFDGQIICWSDKVCYNIEK